MRQIPVFNRAGVSGYVQVDDEDYEDVVRHRWNVTNGYAVRQDHRISIYMHRHIAGTPPEKDTDHIDGNRANNCRDNLRVCTRSQNRCNSVQQRGSRLKGTSFYKRSGKWVAHICFEGRRQHLGYYASEELAHAAYCGAAAKLHGEFVRLS